MASKKGSKHAKFLDGLKREPTVRVQAMPTKFYHGSSRPLDIGLVLGGRSEVGDFLGNEFEQYVESRRPVGLASRLTGVFMVAHLSDIELAANEENLSHVYEVRPLDPVSRHSADYLLDAYYPLAHIGIVSGGRGRGTKVPKTREALKRKADKLIDAYWAGTPGPNFGKKTKYRWQKDVWEYLTARAEVVKSHKAPKRSFD